MNIYYGYHFSPLFHYNITADAACVGVEYHHIIALAHAAHIKITAALTLLYGLAQYCFAAYIRDAYPFDRL